MTRIVSPAAVRAILSRETDQVFVPLIIVEHPSISPIRICHDTTPVERLEGTYLPFPFEFILPNDMQGELPRAAVKFDNVNKEILTAIREITGKPKITFMLVLAESPNTIEYGPAEFMLADAAWDVLTVTGNLSYQDEIWNQQVPGQSYTPSNSPGLFR